MKKKKKKKRQTQTQKRAVKSKHSRNISSNIYRELHLKH